MLSHERSECDIEFCITSEASDTKNQLIGENHTSVTSPLFAQYIIFSLYKKKYSERSISVRKA